MSVAAFLRLVRLLIARRPVLRARRSINFINDVISLTIVVLLLWSSFQPWKIRLYAGCRAEQFNKRLRNRRWINLVLKFPRRYDNHERTRSCFQRSWTKLLGSLKYLFEIRGLIEPCCVVVSCFTQRQFPTNADRRSQLASESKSTRQVPFRGDVLTTSRRSILSRFDTYTFVRSSTDDHSLIFLSSSTFFYRSRCCRGFLKFRLSTSERFFFFFFFLEYIRME